MLRLTIAIIASLLAGYFGWRRFRFFGRPMAVILFAFWLVIFISIEEFPNPFVRTTFMYHSVSDVVAGSVLFYWLGYWLRRLVKGSALD